MACNVRAFVQVFFLSFLTRDRIVLKVETLHTTNFEGQQSFVFSSAWSMCLPLPLCVSLSLSLRLYLCLGLSVCLSVYLSVSVSLSLLCAVCIVVVARSDCTNKTRLSSCFCYFVPISSYTGISLHPVSMIKSTRSPPPPPPTLSI